MLSALRPPEHASMPQNAPPRYTTTSASASHGRFPSDPSELPPDRLHVEMEMSPDSQIILYGPLLRALIAIKVWKYHQKLQDLQDFSVTDIVLKSLLNFFF